MIIQVATVECKLYCCGYEAAAVQCMMSVSRIDSLSLTDTLLHSDLGLDMANLWGDTVPKSQDPAI
jgi:hypothetical protein